MEHKFTEQESLAVISEMISRARNNVQKGAGTFMIYWGATVAAAAVLNIALAFILRGMSLPVNYSFNIWWLMLPAWAVSIILKQKRGRTAIVKSHFDHIISSIWLAFGISSIIFLSAVFALSYSLHEYRYFFYLINPIVLLMSGIGEFITAKVCRFRPFLHGAVAMWAGSAACAPAVIITAHGGVLVQFVILAVCMTAGFVIPGY
ncbi:MAG: hypothetical protein LBI89_01560 [Prevotellaceae bacterium]|jgi:hypothetical protein|nr:hypothetical protein [Prevotellaceae bacterium]